MQIRVLGCSGGAVANQPTTSFLLDDSTLIDAGTCVFNLSLKEQKKIQQIFITHTHFDHIAGLPFLIENVARYRRHKRLEPIKLYASEVALTGIKKHMFNGCLWPDFTRLPNAQNPSLELVALEVGEQISLTPNLSVEAIGAIHTVPTQGYAVHQQNDSWIYTGDTTRNPALWEYINQLPQQGKCLRCLVTETTFVNALQRLASLSGHCTVNDLAKDMHKHLVNGNFDLYVMHLKPNSAKQILRELELLQIVSRAKGCKLHVMQQDQVFTMDAKQKKFDRLELQAA